MCGKRFTYLYNITFRCLSEVLLSLTSVQKKKITLFLWLRAQRVLVEIMLAQRRRRWPTITSALGQCIVLSGVSGAGVLKCHHHNGTITQCCFIDGPTSKTLGQH